ncbi:MAG: hypothetical protein R2851_11125 [Caldilineaceae bacterium]
MDPLQPPATVSVVRARNEEATIAAVVMRCFAAMDAMGRGASAGGQRRQHRWDCARAGTVTVHLSTPARPH